MYLPCTPPPHPSWYSSAVIDLCRGRSVRADKPTSVRFWLRGVEYSSCGEKFGDVVQKKGSEYLRLAGGDLAGQRGQWITSVVWTVGQLACVEMFWM